MEININLYLGETCVWMDCCWGIEWKKRIKKWCVPNVTQQNTHPGGRPFVVMRKNISNICRISIEWSRKNICNTLIWWDDDDDDDENENDDMTQFFLLSLCPLHTHTHTHVKTNEENDIHIFRFKWCCYYYDHCYYDYY